MQDRAADRITNNLFELIGPGLGAAPEREGYLLYFARNFLHSHAQISTAFL
jgi:hypothetical protein